MDRSDISIATMTWARDPREERLLRESLPHLAELDVPTFVTDGGSGREFLNFLHGFPRFRVLEAGAPGVWAQIRRSLRAAGESAGESAARFVLYTEPDKRDFFRERLRGFISDAPAGDEVGVALASRTAESFGTFPEFQRETERAINRCCAEVVGERADFSYGPFLLNRRLVPYLCEAAGDLGWGWRPYAFGTAGRLGYRVVSLPRDLPCPPEQRDDSPAERIYRMRQLTQSVQGLLLSTTVTAARG